MVVTGPWMTTFVGREVERRSLAECCSRSRLVTVTGPGGCGKTRLTFETVAQETEALVIELAAITDGVATALLRGLGAAPAPGEGSSQACVRLLRDSDRVVVLDNCEHVLGEAAALADALLSGCPHLMLIATSRQRLGVDGEQVLRLEPLPVGRSEDGAPSDAARLFSDRARAADSSFTVGDAEAVERLCASLDGLPLALELAASRVAAFSVEELRRECAASPALLEREGPAGDRHRSLDWCVAWSYGLLSEREQAALRALSVFRGSWSLDAGRAVLAVTASPGGESAILVALVDWSLVSAERSTGATTRYRLLDMVRHFAQRCATDHPAELDEARERHLAYLIAEAEAIEPHFAGPQLVSFVASLRLELPDISVAIDWAVSAGRTNDALHLVGLLWRFWWAGAKGDGVGIIGVALRGSGGTADLRARALVAGAMAAASRLDFTASIDMASLAVATSDEPATRAFAHCWLGWALAIACHPDTAFHLKRAAALSAEVGDIMTMADARNAEAYVAMRAGEPVDALATAQDVLALTATTGNQITRCHALATAAIARTMLGDLEAAGANIAEALGLAMAMSDDVYHVMLLVQRARVEVLGDRGDSAAATARLAQQVAATTASALLTDSARAAAGLAAYARGEARTAASELGPAIDAVAVTDQATAVDLAVMLADACRANGDPAAETVAVELATMMAEGSSSRWEQSRSLVAVARHHVHRGRLADAAAAAHLACDLAAELGDTRTQIDAVELLAGFEPPDVALEVRRAAAAARAASGYRLNPLTGEDTDPKLIEEQGQAAGPPLSLADAVRRVGHGRGPRSRPALGWASLTPAERRVVELVAGGLSNPEIAARLIVSRETVKSHVSSALRKLGAANRADLAARAARHLAT